MLPQTTVIVPRFLYSFVACWVWLVKCCPFIGWNSSFPLKRTFSGLTHVQQPPRTESQQQKQLLPGGAPTQLREEEPPGARGFLSEMMIDMLKCRHSHHILFGRIKGIGISLTRDSYPWYLLTLAAPMWVGVSPITVLPFHVKPLHWHKSIRHQS